MKRGRSLKVPPNLTEAEVLTAIDNVVNRLARSFRFGYHEVEDMKQEGRLEALRALTRYDNKRPLENFLYIHVKNRFINFKRDKFRRNDPPCKLCHNSVQGHTQHPNGRYCDKYELWHKRNTTKQNIMNPLDISGISDEKEPHTREESTVLSGLEQAELLSLIDSKLPVELRATYLQMKDGVFVSRARRAEVEGAIKEILSEEEI